MKQVIDGELAHVWVQGKDLKFKPESRLYNEWLCKACGIVRCREWPKYPETACKGEVRITFKGDLP